MSVGRAISGLILKTMQREAARTAAVDTMQITSIDDLGNVDARPGGMQTPGGTAAGFQKIPSAALRDTAIEVGDAALTIKLGGDSGSVVRMGRNPYQDGEEYSFG